MNYDKRKVSNLINNKDNPLTDADILTKSQLELAIKQAKPIKKNKIILNIELKNKNDLVDFIQKTKDILSRQVIAKVIEELKEDQQLSDWVKLGIALHKGKRFRESF